MTNNLTLRSLTLVLLLFLGYALYAASKLATANPVAAKENKEVPYLTPQAQRLSLIQVSEEQGQSAEQVQEVHILRPVDEFPEPVGVIEPVTENITLKETSKEEIYTLTPVATPSSQQTSILTEPQITPQQTIFPENSFLQEEEKVTATQSTLPHNNEEIASIPSSSSAFLGNTEVIEKVPCSTFTTFTKFVSRGEVEGESYHCGYIRVPEKHDSPDSPTIKLGYVILRSTASNPSPVPLLMIQGGPGGSSIELVAAYAFWGSSPALATVRSQRDIVAIDYRGSTYALPRLICSNPQPMILHRATEPNVDDVQVKQEVLKACFDSWQKRGVDLAAFNSVEIANDYALALPALGYPQAHVYGGSYGSIAAQYLMRDYPELLYSVVLDAPVAPYLHWPLNTPQAANDAFEHLFENCKADISCQRNYPNLEKVFTDTVDKLNAQPVALTLNIQGQRQEARLNGDLWVQGLYELMYRDPKQVLSNIFRTSTGDYNAAGKVLVDIITYKSIFSPPQETFVVNSGLYISVTCADEFTFTDADWDFTGLVPQIAKPIAEYLDNDLPELCSAWPVPLLAERLKEPVVSDIPTLVFSAKFDPVTPPIYAEKIASHLSKAQLYISSTDGHSVLNNPCAWQIINVFLDNSSNPPNSNCFEASR